MTGSDHLLLTLYMITIAICELWYTSVVQSNSTYCIAGKFGNFSQNAIFLYLADFEFGDSVHVCILVDRGV